MTTKTSDLYTIREQKTTHTHYDYPSDCQGLWSGNSRKEHDQKKPTNCQNFPDIRIVPFNLMIIYGFCDSQLTQSWAETTIPYTQTDEGNFLSPQPCN
jgi:hypothetical protein